MRNIGPVVALAGALLVFATSGCPDGGGGTTGSRPKSGTPTPPGSATATTSPSPTACTGDACAAIETTDPASGSNPGSASATIAPFVLSAQSTVSQIQVWKGDKTTGIPVSLDGIETLTVPGATACFQFTAEAKYEGGDKAYPLNWSSGNTNLITIDASGNACIATFSAGATPVSAANSIPITATATGSGTNTLKFYIKLKIPASASVTVG